MCGKRSRVFAEIGADVREAGSRVRDDALYKSTFTTLRVGYAISGVVYTSLTSVRHERLV